MLYEEGKGIMSIYCRINEIKGNVTAKGYEGNIDLIDVDFGGIKTSAKMKVGQKMDRMMSSPNFHQVTIIKRLDKSSISFFEHAHSGKVIPQVDILYVTTGDPNFTYSKTTLKEVLISAYNDWHDGENHPTELIRLAYTKIERTFTPRDQNNRPTSPLTTGYDLENAQQI